MGLTPASRTHLVNAASIAGGALILCIHALYNGYPLMYPDTGTYIAACFEHFVPRDRPLTYSFFLRHISLARTLWIPMALQCLMVSWLVMLMFRHFSKTSKPVLWHIGTILVLSFTTGLAVNACFLIPDIFTAVTVLTGALLLFANDLHKWVRVVLMVLFTYAITTHLSHIPLAFALVCGVLLFCFFRRKKPGSRALIRRTLVLSGCIPAAILFTMLLNYSTAQQWEFSPRSRHVFMMNRLIQCGIVSEYLAEKCPVHHYTLCGFNNEPGQDLLWDSHTALNATYGWDGWEKAKPEYDSILSDIFSQRRFLVQYVKCSIRDGARQLITYDVTMMRQLHEGEAAFDVLKRHFPADHRQYVQSRQGRGLLDYGMLNTVQAILCPLSALLVLLLLCTRRLRSRMPMLLPLSIWLLAAMIINALTVVSLSMIDDRFQNRLIWIVPLLVAIYASQWRDRSSAQ